jgi:hypothetical protein
VLLVAGAVCSEGMTVEGRVTLGKMDPSNMKLSLNGLKHYAMTAGDGSFRFYDVPSGIYLLDVLDTNFVFSTMKLKVDTDAQEVNVVEYKYPGAKRVAADYPIVLQPHTRTGYFQKREGFRCTNSFPSFKPKRISNPNPSQPSPHTQRLENDHGQPDDADDGLYGGCDCLFASDDEKHGP